MRRKHLFVVLSCAAVLVAAVVLVWCLRPPQPLYRVTFLPALGGVNTRPHAINDSGRVAATVRMADGTERVVLWDKSGRTEDLASFPAGSSVATVLLNNTGQVAFTVFDPNHVWSSFFRDVDGRQYVLDAPGDGQVQINAMNNRGQVVGHWAPARGPRHAFLWDKTAGMHDLGTFGGMESVACDLNDAGQIVGYFAIGSRNWRAFVCDPNLGMRDLGLKKTGWDGQCLINNRGFIVGQFGPAQPGPWLSTWTARTGSQPLPWEGGDFLLVRGLNDADRYLVDVRYEGVRVWGREFWRRSESHLWESGRHVRRLTGRLCCGDNLRRRDIEAVGGWDVNQGGTILAMLKMRGSAASRVALLEPIR